MAKNSFDKSPLNYIGGKYKILPQIIKFFPKRINNFVDLFAGGLDVAINVNADNIYCNDINKYVIEIYKEFQNYNIDELLQYIDSTIEENNLSKTNKDAYIEFRKKYNINQNPLDLYVLICYSFNYQIRFNNSHKFNNPFGKNRSYFNPTMRDNLIKFHAKIKNFKFSVHNFKEFDISFLKKGDFLYADPPYRITTGTYNDGKRGFEGWGINEDLLLFQLLDQLDSQNVKFALSNVIEHKGTKNRELDIWRKKYHTHKIDFNYSNSNYQIKDRKSITKEVLITNY